MTREKSKYFPFPTRWGYFLPILNCSDYLIVFIYHVNAVIQRSNVVKWKPRLYFKQLKM